MKIRISDTHEFLNAFA